MWHKNDKELYSISNSCATNEDKKGLIKVKALKTYSFFILILKFIVSYWSLRFEKKEDIDINIFLFQKLMLMVNTGCGTRIGNFSISNL